MIHRGLVCIKCSDGTWPLVWPPRAVACNTDSLSYAMIELLLSYCESVLVDCDGT